VYCHCRTYATDVVKCNFRNAAAVTGEVPEISFCTLDIDIDIVTSYGMDISGDELGCYRIQVSL